MMNNIYDEQALENLEEEEHGLTLAMLLLMFESLYNTQAELEKEIRSFYQEYGKDGVITYNEARKWVSEKDHRRRLTAISMLVASSFDVVNKELKRNFSKLVDSVMEKEQTFFGESIDTDTLNLNWGNDNKSWDERLDIDTELWIAYLITDLKRAFVKGDNVDTLLKNVGARFKSITNILKSLTISEISAIRSIMRKPIFKLLGVKKYKFYTRADERTCPSCGDLHGRIFPMSAYEVGVTAPCIHLRCRCWVVPIWH